VGVDPQALLDQFGTQHVAAFFLVLARVSPLFVLAPLFSAKQLPARSARHRRGRLAMRLSPVVSAGKEIPRTSSSWRSSWPRSCSSGRVRLRAGALFAAVQVAGSFWTR